MPTRPGVTNGSEFDAVSKPLFDIQVQADCTHGKPEGNKNFSIKTGLCWLLFDFRDKFQRDPNRCDRLPTACLAEKIIKT